jgi:serine/threonine protein kinase
VTRYELLDRIGVGGMAEIFRGKAVAAGGFEKPVAIKRILPHLSQDKRFVELLIAEAKVLSLLKHRNIVQIFDVGLGDDGQYFLVMEYVDGQDVGAVQKALEVRRKKMPFDLALHVGAEICEALEHAHTARAPDGKAMSLVHRDVSPSNVLLSRAGEVKLTDFGIAKRAEQEATGHGAVRGKFAYISPEQARNEHLDPRSDVFSLGILLWELVTNRRLFSGMGDLEALRAVREAQVPRPSEFDRSLSPELEKLVMSALSREAKSRPTAGQLGAKLRSLRYSLEVTVGDPAMELAKIIETSEQVARESQQMLGQAVPRANQPGLSGMSMSKPFNSFDGVEHTEATVIRIRTADAFSMRDPDGTGMAMARKVIDRFEEEETRLAQLSGDQMRMLRRGREDSSDLSPLPAPRPVALPGMTSPRARRPSDEATRAREPFSTDEIATYSSGAGDLPHQRFDSDESTRLVARSRDRRTPVPERMPRPPTVPPPVPGTVHNRNPMGPAPGPQRSRGPTPGPPTPREMNRGDLNRGGLPLEPPSYSGRSMPSSVPPPMGQAPPGQMPGMMPGMTSQPPPGGMTSPPVLPSPMPQPPGNYPTWGVAPQPPPRGAPTMQDAFNPPVYPQRPSVPQVAGFGRQKRPVLKPWMLVVGALVMAALAFAITRLLLG